MPRGARADGWWAGPRPKEISPLGPLAAKIIRLAHVCCSILLVKLSPEAFAAKMKSNASIPEIVTGNPMAVPQYNEELPQVLGVPPEKLSEWLQVQFEGDLASLAHEPSITISIPLLRRAFAWLLTQLAMDSCNCK